MVDKFVSLSGDVPLLSIGAFSGLVSFSTRIEIPGLLVGKTTFISRCGRILSLFDPWLYLRVLLEKVDCKPAASWYSGPSPLVALSEAASSAGV